MTRIGISGHQDRPGIDWEWTESEICSVFRQYHPVKEALTSLALGSDQIFARVGLTLGVPVSAVIPMIGYEHCFAGEGLHSYEALLMQCKVIALDGNYNDEVSFLNAGRFVVDKSDVLVAIWDGQPAKGLGGTADIVKYSLGLGKTVIHINPILREVRTINEAIPL